MVLALSACADQHAEKHYERTIVIDPGHGGADSGAIGSTRGILEKEVTLRMGLALRDQLEATGRYQVIMTRNEDLFVGLPDRLQIARQSQGELFISLHADSLVSAPKVSGASVYTLSERASNEELARLASKEARGDILAKTDRSNQEDIAPKNLIYLARREANRKSTGLAELLVQELNGPTKMAKRRPAQAAFVVLKSPVMPSVLIELGYLSNPADEKALADDAHVVGLATAVARAVDAYFRSGMISSMNAQASILGSSETPAAIGPPHDIPVAKREVRALSTSAVRATSAPFLNGPGWRFRSGG
jgi:N-acetylmuramoyl-L-alanine amidase